MAEEFTQVGDLAHLRTPMLGVSLREQGGCLVVELSGELDVCSVAGLRRDLARHAVRLVVLDVSALEFCDSSGLGLMVGTFKRLQAVGGGLALAGVREHFGRVLRITGLVPKVIATAEDVDGACLLLGALTTTR